LRYRQFVFNCVILELLYICDRAVSKRDASKAKQVLKEAKKNENIEIRFFVLMGGEQLTSMRCVSILSDTTT
jgi:hypothetical protein